MNRVRRKSIVFSVIITGMAILGCGGGGGGGSDSGGGSENNDSARYREVCRYYYNTNVRALYNRNTDLITEYKKTEYLADNKYTVTNYNNGKDGKAMTADDYASGRYTMEFSADGVSATGVYYSAGSDNKMDTADDIIGDIWKYKYKSAKAQETLQIGYSTGPDGIPFTSDDIIQRVKRTDYDSSGKPSLIIVYSDSGADGDWFTYSDNHVKSEANVTGTYTKSTVDSETYFPYYFRESRYVKLKIEGDTELRVIWNAGPDGIPLNSDDYILSYDKYSYKNDMLSFSYYANGPGIDGKWFTDDDDFTGRETNVTEGTDAYTYGVIQKYKYEKYSSGKWIVTSDRFRQEAYLGPKQITFFACGYYDAGGVFQPYPDGYSGCETLNYYVEYEEY